MRRTYFYWLKIVRQWSKHWKPDDKSQLFFQNNKIVQLFDINFRVYLIHLNRTNANDLDYTVDHSIKTCISIVLQMYSIDVRKIQWKWKFKTECNGVKERENRSRSLFNSVYLFNLLCKIVVRCYAMRAKFSQITVTHCTATPLTALFFLLFSISRLHTHKNTVACKWQQQAIPSNSIS